MKRATKAGLAVAGLTAAAAAAAARFAAITNDVPTTVTDRADPALEQDLDGDAFLTHLAEAVRLDTVVFEDRTLNDSAEILAFHDFLRATYPRTHSTCDVEVVDDQSLLFTWTGSDQGAGPIVLMAHMDVVPIEPGTEDDWTHGPFSGEIADGQLWGRGALDDKGPLIAIFEAVEHLIEEGFVPTRTIHLAFGHDEEIGGTQGAKRVAEVLRDRGVRPWLVVDEGGGVVDSLPGLTDLPVAVVKVAEKGYIDLKLTARGQGGHSSVPPASTAAGKIGAAVDKLERNPMPARVRVLDAMFEALVPVLDRKVAAVLTNLRVTGPAVSRKLAAEPLSDVWQRTSTAVTMISGGVKPNVLPQEAWAVVNFRILPGDSIDSVMDHVRKVVGPDIEIEPYGEMISEPSPFASTESDAWKAVRRSVEESFPDATVVPWILTGATDSRYFMPFSSDVYGFGPFTTSPDLGGIHGTDESMRIADAPAAVSFFCRLIRNAESSAE